MVRPFRLTGIYVCDYEVTESNINLLFLSSLLLLTYRSINSDNHQENPECRRMYSKDSFFIGGNSGSVGDKETHRKKGTSKHGYKEI